jgi:tetratricopeptide (TPR) repeat protein
LAQVHHAADQQTHAQQACEEAIRIQEPLTQQFAAVPHYRSDLARAYHQLGIILLAQKKRDSADKAFLKELDLWQRLAAAHSEEPEFLLGLGSCCYFLGMEAGAAKHAEEALACWYTKVVRVLAPKPTLSADISVTLRNAYWKRAQTHVSLRQFKEALADWEQTLELAAKSERAWFRLYRAETLARAGDHSVAAAEAADLARKAGKSGEALFRLAKLLALAATAATQDARVNMEGRHRLANKYAAEALTLLKACQGVGYFKVTSARAQLQNDPDLAAVRELQDYQKWTASWLP